MNYIINRDILPPKQPIYAKIRCSLLSPPFSTLCDRFCVWESLVSQVSRSAGLSLVVGAATKRPARNASHRRENDESTKCIGGGGAHTRARRPPSRKLLSLSLSLSLCGQIIYGDAKLRVSASRPRSARRRIARGLDYKPRRLLLSLSLLVFSLRARPFSAVLSYGSFLVMDLFLFRV